MRQVKHPDGHSWFTQGVRYVHRTKVEILSAARVKKKSVICTYRYAAQAVRAAISYVCWVFAYLYN